MSVVPEVAVSVMINGAVYSFAESSSAATTLASSLFFQTVAHTWVRSNVTDFAVAKVIIPNMFALITGSNLQLLIHEVGHACSSLILYKDPRPKITLIPFHKGNTHYQTNELTPLGEYCGRPYALALSGFAGPGAALAVSSTAMIVGRISEEKFPMLAQYLIAYGRSDLFAHAIHAFSAYSSSNSRMAHDFYLLSKVGLQPAVAGVIFIAIPLIIEFGRSRS